MKVIIDLAGGFGNQLFCYCFGYALSKEKRADLVLDTSMQDNGVARELELLNLEVKYDQRISYCYKKNVLARAFANKLRKRTAIGFKTNIYKEKLPTVYEPAVFNIYEDTYFKGNWQSEKYFVKYKEDLLNILTPKEGRSKSVKQLCLEMQECCSVAVHVRRGDYVQIGCQLNMEYYGKAIHKMISLLTDKPIILYMFSDEIEYCKQYFSALQKEIGEAMEIRYPAYESDNRTLDDLILMSNCHHMIMANSSYSWWSAWLNKNDDKIVICPEMGMWSGDFYPEEWIKIKCE